MSDITKHDLSFSPPAAARLAQAAARPRGVAMVCIAALSGIAWLYLVALHEQHADIFAVICRPLIGAGSAGGVELGVALAMWGAMVFAMMLPSAAPMIMTYAEIADTAARKRIDVVSPLLLTAGYIVVWLGFALAAAATQIALTDATLLDPHTGSLSITISGALFIGAGLYQFSTLKQACLRQCRSPFAFFFTNWATTRRGVFRLGVKQGLYCLGCCWAAMLLMLALGVMNLVWMAALAAAMTVEKLVGSVRLSYTFGVILIAVGSILISGVGL